MKCDDCESDEGEETTCPYAQEINDETVECVLCEDCYHERCMDI
jgi:hypothetical protein